MKVFLVIEYLKILETDIYVIVKNTYAWKNSRKMNENKVKFLKQIANE